MKHILRSFFALSFFVLVLQGCYYDKADKLYTVSSITCDTTNITYSTVIKPIIQQNCSIPGCHDASQSGGYDFTTYDGLKNALDRGRVIGSINHLSGYIAMPQTGSKLSSCDINKITIWVNNGYMNN